MTETIRQLTFIRKGRLEWREVPRPALRSAESALVRPLSAARCDGDGLFLFHDYSRALALGACLRWVDPEVRELGARPFAGPFAYGHECIAEIVEIGEAVATRRVGEHVVVPWAISCGSCRTCVRGFTSHCERSGRTLAAYGLGGRAGGWGGAVSDLVCVPYADAMLVPVPAGVAPLELASASDNLTDAWRSVAPHLRAEPGAPVLVVGGAAASIGLYAAGLAVALGASRVDYADSDSRRLAQAEALGARALELAPSSRSRRPLPSARDYLVSVEASSSEAGLRLAIGALAAGGVCTSVGYLFRKGTPLPLWHMFLKGTRLDVGVANARAHLPDLLAFIAAGRFRPSRIATLVADWDDAPEALLDRSATKVVVTRSRPSSQQIGRTSP